MASDSIFPYPRLWMSGLHESAAGDNSLDRKLRILEYFLRSTSSEEDKAFINSLISDTKTRTSQIIAQWL